MPFFLTAMGIIPFIWFPTNEQGKAIGYISLAIPFGALVAVCLPVIFIEKYDDSSMSSMAASDNFYNLILT